MVSIGAFVAGDIKRFERGNVALDRVKIHKGGKALKSFPALNRTLFQG